MPLEAYLEAKGLTNWSNRLRGTYLVARGGWWRIPKGIEDPLAYVTRRIGEEPEYIRLIELDNARAFLSRLLAGDFTLTGRVDASSARPGNAMVSVTIRMVSEATYHWGIWSAGDSARGVVKRLLHPTADHLHHVIDGAVGESSPGAVVLASVEGGLPVRYAAGGEAVVNLEPVRPFRTAVDRVVRALVVKVRRGRGGVVHYQGGSLEWEP
jgi:hypothetical protein